MSKVRSMTDEQVIEVVRSASPLAESDCAAIDASASGAEASRLLQRILASDRSPAGGGRTRRKPRPRRLVLTVASASSVAAAVAVAAVVLSAAGNSPSVAFAGWSAEPTVPASGQLQSAETECQSNPSLASLAPTVADTRGPYTLLVYGETSGGVCVTGPSLRSPTGQPPVAPFRFRGSTITASIASNTVQRIDTAVVVGKAAEPASTFSFNDGRVGAGVVGVTLVLKDGSRITATTSNGWFVAWWPGEQEAQSAVVEGVNGAHTQRLVPGPGYETATSSAHKGSA